MQLHVWYQVFRVLAWVLPNSDLCYTFNMVSLPVLSNIVVLNCPRATGANTPPNHPSFFGSSYNPSVLQFRISNPFTRLIQSVVIPLKLQAALRFHWIYKTAGRLKTNQFYLRCFAIALTCKPVTKEYQKLWQTIDHNCGIYTCHVFCDWFTIGS